MSPWLPSRLAAMSLVVRECPLGFPDQAMGLDTRVSDLALASPIALFVLTPKSCSPTEWMGRNRHGDIGSCAAGELKHR